MKFMELDDYGEVVNAKRTYEDIGILLLLGKSVIIGWTDSIYTHYDILFTYNPIKQGYLQRGLKANDLYVSVMSRGSFGFDITNKNTDSGYVAEKLNLQDDETSKKLTELINNIKNILVSKQIGGDI